MPRITTADTKRMALPDATRGGFSISREPAPAAADAGREPLAVLGGGERVRDRAVYSRASSTIVAVPAMETAAPTNGRGAAPAGTRSPKSSPGRRCRRVWDRRSNAAEAEICRRRRLATGDDAERQERDYEDRRAHRFELLMMRFVRAKPVHLAHAQRLRDERRATLSRRKSEVWVIVRGASSPPPRRNRLPATASCVQLTTSGAPWRSGRRSPRRGRGPGAVELTPSVMPTAHS